MTCTLSKRLVGPGAGARKYDLLTAIALAGLTETVLSRTLALRLIALVTARYDWARDQVAVGHTELTRLWSVSRRTVIRDVDKLMTLGVLRRVAEGRRGRVSVYRLGHDALDVITAPLWPKAGRPLEERMTRPSAEAVPLQRPPVLDAPSPWRDARDRLAAALGDATMIRWIDPLRFEAAEGGVLMLGAPSRFMADYVAQQFGLKVEAAAAAAFGARLRLSLRVEGEGTSLPRRAARAM